MAYAPQGPFRRRAAIITALTLVASALIPIGPAFAVSPDITLSQVYGGGGGNVGAPYNHDFIELYNRGAATVTVTGWTVQYASATGPQEERDDHGSCPGPPRLARTTTGLAGSFHLCGC